MYIALNLKVHGMREQSELKLVEMNLKSQEGVKSLKVISHGNYAEIKLEIDDKIISKKQIFDTIMLGGDFRIEEFNHVKVGVTTTKDTVAEAVEKRAASTSIKSDSDNSAWSGTSSKTYLVWGLLVGFSIMSLLLNIIFGYQLMKSRGSATQADSNNKQITQNNTQPSNPPPAQRAVASTPAAVQNFTITKSDHVRGDFNAPITLVEYSDFQCPYCGRHYPTVKKILADYPGKVRLIYKHFPLSFHENAQKAAEAAECASEQNKFWEYHDVLFENQSGGFSIDNFKQWAKDLNLDAVQFNNCLDSDKYASRVQADESGGQNRGVQGVPATFVNGQLISGALPYESFKSIIDKILNNN